MTLRELFETFLVCGPIGLSRNFVFEYYGPELEFYDEGDVCEFDIVNDAGLLDAEVMGLNTTLVNGRPMLEIGLMWDSHKHWPTKKA